MTARALAYLIEFGVIGSIWGAFMIGYHISTRGTWHRMIEGWHIMVTSGIIAGNAILAVVNLSLGEYPYRAWIGGTAYALFGVAGIWRIVLQRRAVLSRRIVARSTQQQPAS